MYVPQNGVRSLLGYTQLLTGKFPAMPPSIMSSGRRGGGKRRSNCCLVATQIWPVREAEGYAANCHHHESLLKTKMTLMYADTYRKVVAQVLTLL